MTNKLPEIRHLEQKNFWQCEFWRNFVGTRTIKVEPHKMVRDYQLYSDLFRKAQKLVNALEAKSASDRNIGQSDVETKDIDSTGDENMRDKISEDKPKSIWKDVSENRYLAMYKKFAVVRSPDNISAIELGWLEGNEFYDLSGNGNRMIVLDDNYKFCEISDFMQDYEDLKQRVARLEKIKE